MCECVFASVVHALVCVCAVVGVCAHIGVFVTVLVCLLVCVCVFVPACVRDSSGILRSLLASQTTTRWGLTCN